MKIKDVIKSELLGQPGEAIELRTERILSKINSLIEKTKDINTNNSKHSGYTKGWNDALELFKKMLNI